MTDHPASITDFAATQLGPESATRFADRRILAEVEAAIAAGTAFEDAVLGVAFREAKRDRLVADEFIGYFLAALTRIGHINMRPALRRYLDTGDLVQSVLGSMWEDIQRVEFQGRAAFLSYLARRLQWKASDRARGMNSGRRQEDRRMALDPEDVGRARTEPGPGTIAGQEEELERIGLAIPLLQPRDQSIIRLLACGVGHDEIGARLGLAPAAARQAIRRARERFEEVLLQRETR